MFDIVGNRLQRAKQRVIIGLALQQIKQHMPCHHVANETTQHLAQRLVSAKRAVKAAAH